MMARYLRSVCAILIIHASVHSQEVSRPPTLVDKLISDYFEAVDIFWISIEKRTENVLAKVEKRFADMTLDGEDEVHLLFRIEEVEKNDYGEQISKITRDLRYGVYQTRIKTSSEFYDRLTKLRNVTTMLDGIALLDGFWEAALETASKSPCASYSTVAPQQMLLKYYYYIQMEYLRCFLGFQQLYMTASIQLTGEHANYKSQTVALSEEFRTKFSKVRTAAQKYFRLASKESLTCRPYSYTTVTNFLQGFVDNEANLNPESSCSSQCSDYKETKHFQCQTGSFCDTNEYKGNTPNLRCNGIIRDCSEIDASDVVLCLNHHESTRRYNGIRINNKIVAGRDIGSCQIKANAWNRGFYRCTNCYCHCDDPSISERHFSLRDVVSDIRQNKVLTHIRMNKVNGVIQFQVKERILLPFAVADKRDNVLTVDGWQSAPLFYVTDPNVTKDVDFYELSYDKRSINLDKVTLSKGQLVTGIRFCVKNGHLTIEIRGTAFDYVTGILKDESEWISKAKGYNEISLARLSQPHENDRYFDMNVSNATNAFVKFGPTEYSQDIGQTTIPFIETASTESNHFAPLAGVGLYYKSTKYSSGFVAAKLITYDIEPHFLE